MKSLLANMHTQGKPNIRKQARQQLAGVHRGGCKHLASVLGTHFQPELYLGHWGQYISHQVAAQHLVLGPNLGCTRRSPSRSPEDRDDPDGGGVLQLVPAPQGGG